MPVSPARPPKRPQTPEKSCGSNLVWVAVFVAIIKASISKRTFTVRLICTPLLFPDFRANIPQYCLPHKRAAGVVSVSIWIADLDSVVPECGRGSFNRRRIEVQPRQLTIP